MNRYSYSLLCGHEKKQVGSSFPTCFCLLAWHPVRCDLQFFDRLSGIVGLYWNFEQVLALHAFVHHNVHVDRGGLTGL